ncbi:MAG: hypothetical protein B6242_17070 [Anaerolineaceae bacterium 4572_78]|nr:MAG: hypothetical protein B6242_17070 [Anaerolineaceae bacterium 4572_78]
MWEDVIVNEVRRVREMHAQRFNFDLQSIFEDLKRQELESGKEFVSFAPKPPIIVLIPEKVNQLEKQPV